MYRSAGGSPASSAWGQVGGPGWIARITSLPLRLSPESPGASRIVDYVNYNYTPKKILAPGAPLARWNSYATAKHSTLVPAAAFFYFTQGAWRFHPRCGASLLPLLQPTVAELLLPQFLLPAIRRAQWALHVTSTRSFLLPLSQPTQAVAELLLLLLPQFLLHVPAIRRAQAALSGPCTSPPQVPLVVPTRLCTPTTPPSGAVKLGRSW